MRAYGGCLGGTSTDHAAWHVVPADNKDDARLTVSQIVPDAKDGLGNHPPKASDERRAELLAIRKQLAG